MTMKGVSKMNLQKRLSIKKSVLIILVCLTVNLLSVSPVFGQAKGNPYFQTPIGAMLSGKRHVIWYVTKYGYTSPGAIFYNYKIGLPSDTRIMKVKNLKCSNPKVVSVSLTEADDRSFYITCNPRKAGTANIQFQVKVQGKTYKYAIPYTVIKYTNPVKTLKIGSVNYASKFKKSGVYIIGKKFSGKLYITPQKGWKLDRLYTYTELDDAEPEECMQIHKYKKGMKITVNKGQHLSVEFKNTKGVVARCSLYS